MLIYNELHMFTRLSVVCLASVCLAMAQAPEGRTSFQTRCSVCHGTDGNGGEHAPSILARLRSTNDQELTAFLREGIPLRGMPAFNDVPAPEMTALVAFLRTIAPQGGRGGGRGGPPVRTKVQLTDGKTLEGAAIGRTSRELQLRTDDQRIHLLEESSRRTVS